MIKTRINQKIKRLNQAGIPAIFIITGNNSSGKTVIAKKLIRDVDFHQTINLGLISKTLRFLEPNFKSDELDNFNGAGAQTTFDNIIGNMISSYCKTGVNAIIEGVQINTQEFSLDERILGGIVLSVEYDRAIERGQKPETHFNRAITSESMKKMNYIINKSDKFKIIDNNGSIEDSFNATIEYLEHLLDGMLAHHE